MPFPKLDFSSIIAISILGVFQIGLSSILFSFAIKKITAVSANLIAVIEPVFNPFWVFLVFAEKPGINTVAGGLIIVLAVVVSSIFTVRNRGLKMLKSV